MGIILKKNNLEESDGGYLKFFSFLPLLLILATVIYIVIMLFLVYLVDFRGMDILGLQGWLELVYPDYPLFWIYAFTEGSPTEKIQWFFLAASIVFTITFYFIKKSNDSRVPWGLLLLFLGLSLMLFEDYYNIRHKTVDFIASYYNILPSHKFFFLHLRTLVEMVLYSILGFIMVSALFFLLKDKREPLAGKKMLVAGYLFYAVASISSATRGIGNWYASLGRRILGEYLIEIAPQVTQPPYRGNLGFYFVDFVLEEPLELLGAAFLAASLLTLIVGGIKKRHKLTPPTQCR